MAMGVTINDMACSSVCVIFHRYIALDARCTFPLRFCAAAISFPLRAISIDVYLKQDGTSALGWQLGRSISTCIIVCSGRIWGLLRATTSSNAQNIHHNESMAVWNMPIALCCDISLLIGLPLGPGPIAAWWRSSSSFFPIDRQSYFRYDFSRTYRLLRRAPKMITRLPQRWRSPSRSTPYRERRCIRIIALIKPTQSSRIRPAGRVSVLTRSRRVLLRSQSRPSRCVSLLFWHMMLLV